MTSGKYLVSIESLSLGLYSYQSSFSKIFLLKKDKLTSVIESFSGFDSH